MKHTSAPFCCLRTLYRLACLVSCKGNTVGKCCDRPRLALLAPLSPLWGIGLILLLGEFSVVSRQGMVLPRWYWTSLLFMGLGRACAES